MRNKKLIWITTILLVMVVALNACSPAAPEEPAPAPEEPAPAPEEPAPAPEEPAVDERGTLRFTDGLQYGGNENLDSVDEARFWPTISLIYDRLTEPAFDSMTPNPSLAESWESNEDANVWTFHLREDVYFHDGTQLTSADVAYSANHWKTSETSILATSFQIVDSIETPDDFTVVFNLTAPLVTFDLTVMDYRARVVPKDGFPSVLETGMGSGPFKLETLDVEGITVLVANDDYWDGPPGVKAVEVYAIAESEAQTTALLSGQLDFQGVTLDIAQRFEGNDDFIITQIPSGDWSGLVMRTDIPPFDNLPLRQAMHLVMDRQKLVDLALSGAGTVSCDSPVMPSDPNVYSDCYEQDIEAAKAKLAEAGYPDGFTIDLYASSICQDWEALTEIYQQDAALAGIDVEIVTVSADGFWSEQWMVEPFVITCWNARLADAALNEIYRGGGSWNESFWNVPEFDALLDAARAEKDADVRRQYYQDAQQMLHEDGGTLIPYYSNLIRVQKSCVDGIPPLSDIWIDWDGITKDSSCD
ncbi:MAG: ABC transporter substrate-binding protein [Anaerolineae bacterium]|nr:ABC transporter substrate-binding protein [Anaerolineae bacterium]